MHLLLRFVLALLTASAYGMEDSPSLSQYVQSVSPIQNGRPRITYARRQVEDGSLVVGFIEPDSTVETIESQAVVFVALERPDGRVIEIAKSAPFAYYTASGRLLVTDISISSSRRFSVQFNHLGACTSGFEIYRFALVAKLWRVAGRDGNQFHCNPADESSGDTRSEWSGNFVTGRVLAKEYRQNKLVSSTSTQTAFPIFPLSSFVAFEERHGPR